MESYSTKLTNDGDLSNFIVTFELLLGKEAPVCFDIGAYKGIWGEGIFLYHPDAKIHFFEPNPDNFALLLENTAPYKAQSTYHNLAISNKEETLTFCKGGPQSHSRSLESDNSFTVQAKQINEFFPTYIDIVKIDTEGADLKVLETLLPYAQENRIGAIVTEFTTFWYGKTIDEVLRATQIVRLYFKIYKYCFALSRNGSPFIVGPITDSNFESFVAERFANGIQSDLYFMNQLPQQIKKYEFELNKYYV